MRSKFEKFLFWVSLLTTFLASSPAFSESIVPSGALLLSLTPTETVGSSKVLGGELQLNLRAPELPIAIGFHGLYQSQQYGSLDTSRWGWGGSLNVYHRIDTALITLGYKTLFYSGGGKTQDALDCLYCSNVEESYSGGENFLVFGFILDNFVIQINKRITDNRSKWSESAYDPYGVGSNYYLNTVDVPDPEIIFQIGVGFN